MRTFTFDVDFSASKDTLKSGTLVSGTSRVSVQAESLLDARLVAEQMVCVRGEPTGVRLCI